MTELILAAVSGSLAVGWGAYAVNAEYRVHRLKHALTRVAEVVTASREKRRTQPMAVEDAIVRLRLAELMKGQAVPADDLAREKYRRVVFGAYFTKWPRSSLRQFTRLMAEVLDDGPGQ